MSGLESDTIGGFNAMIQKQKKEDGEAYVSTILFDNVSEVLHDRIKLADVPSCPWVLSEAAKRMWSGGLSRWKAIWVWLQTV